MPADIAKIDYFDETKSKLSGGYMNHYYFFMLIFISYSCEITWMKMAPKKVLRENAIYTCIQTYIHILFDKGELFNGIEFETWIFHVIWFVLYATESNHCTIGIHISRPISFGSIFIW
jgi:hypothetical protein